MSKHCYLNFFSQFSFHLFICLLLLCRNPNKNLLESKNKHIIRVLINLFFIIYLCHVFHTRTNTHKNQKKKKLFVGFVLGFNPLERKEIKGGYS